MRVEASERGTTRARRRWFAVVAAVAALAVGCQSGTWMGWSGPKVAVIGDSLICHAEGNVNGQEHQRLLADQLVDAGYQANVSGWVGETFQAAHVDLWPAVAGDADLDTLVLALGNNDLHNGLAPDSVRAVLRQWLAEAAGVRCVVVLGVDPGATAWQFDALAPAFNDLLREEAASFPNTRYVPWALDPTIRGTSGDVHHGTEEARAAYRDAIQAAIDGCATTTDPEPTTTTAPDESTTTTAPDESTTTTTVVEESTTTTTVVDEPTTTVVDPDPAG